MDMLLGRNLRDAICLLAARGIEPTVEQTGNAGSETSILRVVQVLDEGRRLRVAAFPSNL